MPDLTYEKEEKEVERLIGRKPAPSRKRAPRRGPKYDNRRRRIRIDDPDIQSFDKDLSLSQKNAAILAIALRMSGFQSSYGTAADREMPVKTATYHGVVKQGHPSGPYPGWRSYDKRYFGKEHYDSIVRAALDLLKEDWLKHGWDGGAPDAPYRAALDLAIHTADHNLYQSKIDAETYNMLLARIQGNQTQLFSETPNVKAPNRSASVMNNAHKNLLRIASELRHTDPKAAIEIVRNMRSLVAQERQEDLPDVSVGQVSAVEQEAEKDRAPRSTQSQERQCAGDKEVEDFLKGRLDIKDLKTNTKKLVSPKDIDDFIEGLKNLADLVKKTAAASRVAAGMPLPELSVLEDMDDEQVKKFLAEQSKAARQLEKSLTEYDIESFLEGLDKLFENVGEAARRVKTSSVRVNISTLIRVAADNPEARAALMPALIAAKKKVEKAKKKGKKTSQKTSQKTCQQTERAKKKASVEVSSSDLNW